MKCSRIILSLLLATTVITTHGQDNDQIDSAFTMTLSRTINAPLESVWTAWGNSDLVKRWWGPEGFSAPVANMNFKEGGVSLVCMRSPDGFEIYTSWTYTAIRPLQRIEFVQQFTDKDGKPISPTELGLPPGIPGTVPHIIQFEGLGNGTTRVSITESGYGSQQATAISKAGMQQCLDKMERLLSEKKTNTRQLTPKEQVYWLGTGISIHEFPIQNFITLDAC